jgi:hypothetical protein
VRTGLVGDFSEAKKIFSTLPSRSKKFSYCPNDLSNDFQGHSFMLYDRSSLEKHPEKKKICEKFYLFFQKIQQIRNRDRYDASEIDGIGSDGRTQEKIKEKVVASSWRQGVNQRRY